jgi:hypothetical protein
MEAIFNMTTPLVTVEGPTPAAEIFLVFELF